MPNLVNKILLDELKSEFESMGSCLVVQFDNLQPKQDLELRAKMREVGVKYRVVRNRLAARAFEAINLDLAPALTGKCAVAVAGQEDAISAAKALRDFAKEYRKAPPVKVVGGVLEGTVYVGDAAVAIAELPDRDTVRTMIASAIAGPARSVATCVSGLASGLARCIQARVDQGEGGSD